MRKKIILIVDDNKDLLTVLEERFSSAGYDVFRSLDGMNIVKRVKEIMPDIILLDIKMPGLDGFEVKDKLNKNAHTAGIPVIFLTGKDSLPDKVRGLDLGADDYITKP